MSAKKAKKSAYPAGVPYESDLLTRLKDPKYQAEYLNSCLNHGGDPDEELEVFIAAIGKIVKAIGIADIAHEMEMSRDSLYKIITEHQNPKTKTLLKLLSVLQLEFEIVPKSGAIKRPLSTR